MSKRMSIYLVIHLDGEEVATQVEVTTMPQTFQGQELTGVDPDTLRHGLRISERVADFADQVRTT